MLMFAGLTIIFVTMCVGMSSVDAQPPLLSDRSKGNKVNIPEDCSVCGISTERSVYHMVSGGTPVIISRTYPWMVSLRLHPRVNSCGGAIIDEFHILTAAHCVYENAAQNSFVYFQAPSPKNMSFGFHIEKIISHRKFYIKNSKGGIEYAKYDIALLKLKDKIKCDEYKNPICLPDADFKLPLGAKSEFAGWGLTHPKDKLEFPPLLHGRTKHLNFASCIKPLPEAEEIKDHTLCQGGTKQSICYGDSGGPLMHKIQKKYYVVGIVSTETDKGCAPTAPAIFTDVAKFVNWIHKGRKKSFLSLKGSKNHHKQRCRNRRKLKKRKMEN